MTNTSYLWIILVLVSTIYTLILKLFIFPQITHTSRKVLLSLTIFELFLSIYYLLSWPNLPFWNWFLDVDSEKNLAAIFSSTQLILTGVLAGYHAFTQHRWLKLYWGFLAGAFLFMGLDEYYMFHEPFFHTWEYIYAGVGLALFLSSAATFWFAQRHQITPFALLIGGLGLMGAGGLLIEIFVYWQGCYGCLQPWADGCARLQVFEEFFEMGGVSLILIALLHYAQQPRPTLTLNWQRLTIISSIFWSALLIAQTFFIPALECRWLAQPTLTSYQATPLQLTGYRVTPTQLTSKTDKLRLTLYWRTDVRLTNEYGISAHLLTQPEISSLTQNDITKVYPPHRAWLPGQTVKQHVELIIPPEMPRDTDYWLTLTLWQQPWQEHHTLNIQDSYRELVTPNTLILQTMPACP
ncbi:MAG: hypothetical protein U9Q70_06585 [Chloroflexota bacterium]|nr:hypothetical protein [Chloroflexota bacterium]